MAIKVKDIAWLGGLLEEEGWFGLHLGHYPSISLGMTDEDTVVKAATLNGMYTMAKCHPDRKVIALGLCSACYQQQWKKKQLLKLVG